MRPRCLYFQEKSLISWEVQVLLRQTQDIQAKAKVVPRAFSSRVPPVGEGSQRFCYSSLSLSRRKSRSPSPAPADSAMASSTASSIPCQNDRATAARCEDQLPPKGTESRKLP